MQAVQSLQGVGGVLPHNVLGQGGQVVPGRHPSRLVDHLQGHMPVPPQTLVQQGKGVPHGPIGDPGDEQGRVVVQLRALLLCHLFQPPGDVLRGNALEVEPLAPGQNGGQQLVDLCGGQNKDDVGGGLLQGL